MWFMSSELENLKQKKLGIENIIRGLQGYYVDPRTLRFCKQQIAEIDDQIVDFKIRSGEINDLSKNLKIGELE